MYCDNDFDNDVLYEFGVLRENQMTKDEQILYLESKLRQVYYLAIDLDGTIASKNEALEAITANTRPFVRVTVMEFAHKKHREHLKYPKPIKESK